MLTGVGNTEDRSRDDMRGNTSDIGGRRKVGRIEENRRIGKKHRKQRG